MNPDLQVFEQPAQVAQALAQLFIDSARIAIAEAGRFRVALAGGTTPQAAYELLGQEPLREGVFWSDAFIYFGDERCVPSENEQSNFRMANEAFLSRIEIPLGNIHRMHGEDEPHAAAASYARVLVADMGALPRFDLLLLGLGPDGHTASLFPGTPPTTDDALLVRAPFVPKFQTYRLTVTPRVINNARHVVFTTQGEEKAAALAAVLEGPREPEKYPAQIVNPTSGSLTWLVDRAAASQLKNAARFS
ncbi:MAG: 6-phosphogluconolactonase [Candidatus Eremiobacteraeota bacterium]|nr:6-phosphogluconolactonase [Candidatus Eremiobacteraeota bacterium]